MNRKEKIESLIKIADTLDRINRHDLADSIDSIIKTEMDKPEDIELEIPQEEFDMLKQLYESLGDSLK